MLISEILRAKETPWGEERIDLDAADNEVTFDSPNWEWASQGDKIAIASKRGEKKPRYLFMLDLASKQVIGVMDLWRTEEDNVVCVGNIQVKKAHAGQRFAYSFYRYAIFKAGYVVRTGDVHTPASERTWVRLTQDPEFTVLAKERKTEVWSEVRVVNNKTVYAGSKGKSKDPYTGDWDNNTSHGPQVHLYCFRKGTAPQPQHRFRPVTETVTQAYLRFGDLPQGGVSKIGRAPNWLAGAMHRSTTEELGVSVYEIEWMPAFTQYYGPNPPQRWNISDVGNYASLDELLAQCRPAYMVTGDRAIDPEDGLSAYGIDGEPLLTNVKIVRQMEYKELYVSAWGQDPLPEEYLELFGK